MTTRPSVIAVGLAVIGAATFGVWRVDARTLPGQTQTPPPVPVPRPFPGASTPSSTPPKPSDPGKTAAPPKTNDPVRTADPNDARTPPVVDAPLTPPLTAAQSATPGAPTEAMLGVKVYPNAQFLQSVDAGRGQRYYLYGTNAPYADIVKYYQGIVKSGGRELIKAPPMQQFDLGKFQDQTMAFQPSVVVKDYTWNTGTGYLFVDAGREERFKTVIQIVPATVSGR